MKSKDEVLEFLSESVPPSGTSEWADWKATARTLGKNGPPAAFQLLQFGNEIEQSSALIALREMGFEALAEGYGLLLTYKVRKLGEVDWDTIVPSSPPDEASPSDGRATGTK